jgi:hypothetical protein
VHFSPSGLANASPRPEPGVFFFGGCFLVSLFSNEMIIFFFKNFTMFCQNSVKFFSSEFCGVYMYVCIYLRERARERERSYMSYVYVYMYVHIYICVYVYAYIYLYVYGYICIYVYIYVCIYIHIYSYHT